MNKAYMFPVTVARPFNTYGRLKNKHFVVERIITQMLQGETVNLGDPNPVRDMLFVDDHVRAYVSLIINRERAVGHVFNFCTGVGYSIWEMVNMIRELTEYEGEVNWNTIPPRPLDIEVLIGDNSKASKVLGWSERTSFEDGLRWCVNHWRTQLE
jgi:nucleoside-diphosphate-sugar epimerase